MHSFTRRNFVTCLLMHMLGCIVAIWLPINGYGNGKVAILVAIAFVNVYIPLKLSRQALQTWMKQGVSSWRSFAFITAFVLYGTEGWASAMYLNTLAIRYDASEDPVLFHRIGSALLIFTVVHLGLLCLIWTWGRRNEPRSSDNRL